MIIIIVITIIIFISSSSSSISSSSSSSSIQGLTSHKLQGGTGKKSCRSCKRVQQVKNVAASNAFCRASWSPGLTWCT